MDTKYENKAESLEHSVDSKESQAEPSLEKNFGWWSLSLSVLIDLFLGRVSASFGIGWFRWCNHYLWFDNCRLLQFMCCCYFGELISLTRTLPVSITDTPVGTLKNTAFITALFSYFGCASPVRRSVLPSQTQFFLCTCSTTHHLKSKDGTHLLPLKR